MVVLISDDTTGDLVVVHPESNGAVTTGAMTLTESYKMELGTKTWDGTMTDRRFTVVYVLIHLLQVTHMTSW